MTGVLLDFSNMRVGGGLQVASATLADLARREMTAPYSWIDDRLEIWLSPAVQRNLTIDMGRLPGRVVVKNTRPTPLALIKPARHHFDLRFTLFGPTYTGRLAACEIVGFAEVTLVYDRHEYVRERRRPTLRERFADVVKRRLVRGYDVYVVETQAIADRLHRRYDIQPDRIHVVPNQPHVLFAASGPLDRPGRGPAGELHVAFPTRHYPHKNLEIVGETASALKAGSGLHLVVHTTLRPDEWERLSPETRNHMRNHGEVTPAELLRLYGQVDGIFFPSLLEASSATPLEANILGLPLVASDRDFVRASADAFALFDPAEPLDAALALARLARNADEAWAQAASVAARRLRQPNVSRTRRYLDLVTRCLARDGQERSRMPLS